MSTIRILPAVGLFLTLLTFSFGQSDPGVTADTVVLGSSLPLTGPFSIVGQQSKIGLDTYIQGTNDAGGINGRKLKLVTRDDTYEPIPCVKNTLGLINEDHVFALTCYVGTPTSVKAQTVWQGAKVPVVGFYTGAKALRDPFNRYNIHVRPSYGKEVNAAIDALVNKLKCKKIAIFYQNDAFGEAVKVASEGALTKQSLTPAAYGTYARGTLDIEKGLADVSAAQPDAVIMVGTYAPLAKFVSAAKSAGLTKTYFYTVSFVGSEALAKELGANTDHVLVSQVIPPYTNNQLPIVQEYVTRLKKYYPTEIPTFASLEAYINGTVVGAGLLAAGKDLTRENFITAIEGLKDVPSLKGIALGYGATSHEGLSDVYLTQLKGGQWLLVDDWATL